jgi:hypothetical protein
MNLAEISKKIDDGTVSEEEAKYYVEQVKEHLKKAKIILEEVKKIQAE